MHLLLQYYQQFQKYIQLIIIPRSCIYHFLLDKPNNVEIKIQFSPFTQQNFEKFSNELSELDWEFNDCNNLDVNFNSFITKLD